MEENVEPAKSLITLKIKKKFSKPYSGLIKDSSFYVRRNINYRNSFLPEIKGQVTAFLNHTRIEISMKPHTVVVIFITLWLIVVGIVCIILLLIFLFHDTKTLSNDFSPIFLIPFLMFAFGFSLMYFGFKVEAKNSKRFFLNLLEGREDKP